MAKYLGLSYHYIPSIPYEIDMDMGLGHYKANYDRTRVNITQGHLYEKPVNIEKNFIFDREAAEYATSKVERKLKKWMEFHYQ